MLYIVATPIGNLGEITYRAVETLKSVDAVLCEDTRRTLVLMRHLGIEKPLVSYQKFSEREKVGYVVERLMRGDNLALVSDAGMPLISDPGKILVEELIKNGLEYTVVSGPCALINAVVLSGMDTSAFCMVGFLPEKRGERVKLLQKFKDLRATLIFYSPPHDIRRDIAFLYETLGDRKAAIVREITKLHEEVVRGTLGDFPDFTERGEFVLVVEGAPDSAEDFSFLTIAQHVEKYVAVGENKKDAIKKVAQERKTAKSLVYAEYEKYLAQEKK